MPTPFPGMDPYLERREFWKEVHAGLIAEIQQFLAPLVRPRYRLAVEQRSYLAVLSPDELPDPYDALGRAPTQNPVLDIPASCQTIVTPQIAELPRAEEVIERYLEIHEVSTGEVVTAIEILSHSTKSSPQGREQYEHKRLALLASLTNLVEIDLLRAGRPMPMRVSGQARLGDYRLLVSRARFRPRADVYIFGVRDAIPALPIPLHADEAEPVLPLTHLVHDIYDHIVYDLPIDYNQFPIPPLEGDDVQWAVQRIRQHLISRTDL